MTDEQAFEILAAALNGDLLDGCELEFDDPLTNCPDEAVDTLVLFADVQFDDPDEVAQRVRDYEELFGDGS